MTQTELPAWIHNAAMRQARTSGPVTCPHPGCGRGFANEWAGRTHYRLAHVIRRKAKAKKKIVRGPYKKRNTMAIGTKPANESKQHDHMANFCPVCACNLKAVNMALKITGEQ